MRKATFVSSVVLVLAAAVQAQGMDPAPHGTEMGQARRQAEVARRGTDVMPFSLPATQHIFTRTAQGGIQEVVARNGTDTGQVKLVRQHLRDIRAQFLAGDYSGPAHIHGQDMPGLAELRAAPAGKMAIAYQDIEGGARLTYSTTEPTLVAALHKWFDAQLSDHGKDAMAGHDHHHPGRAR